MNVEFKTAREIRAEAQQCDGLDCSARWMHQVDDHTQLCPSCYRWFENETGPRIRRML